MNRVWRLLLSVFDNDIFKLSVFILCAAWLNLVVYLFVSLHISGPLPETTFILVRLLPSFVFLLLFGAMLRLILDSAWKPKSVIAAVIITVLSILDFPLFSGAVISSAHDEIFFWLLRAYAWLAFVPLIIGSLVAGLIIRNRATDRRLKRALIVLMLCLSVWQLGLGLYEHHRFYSSPALDNARRLSLPLFPGAAEIKTWGPDRKGSHGLSFTVQAPELSLEIAEFYDRWFREHEFSPDPPGRKMEWQRNPQPSGLAVDRPGTLGPEPVMFILYLNESSEVLGFALITQLGPEKEKPGLQKCQVEVTPYPRYLRKRFHLK